MQRERKGRAREERPSLLLAGGTEEGEGRGETAQARLGAGVRRVGGARKDSRDGVRFSERVWLGELS
jgi:hypothetical protein